MSLPTPVYHDGLVTLYHADYRDLLDELPHADAVVTDPPYGETSLTWDRWPTGWPADAARLSDTLWCFGSMRMLLARGADIRAGGWRFAQDVVWRKHAGTGFVADRFRRVHEFATHWYRGPWHAQHRAVPRVPSGYATLRRPVHHGANHVPHAGAIGAGTWTDDGTRLMRSVIDARNMRGRAVHPTEKPVEVLTPLIAYSTPPPADW